MKSILILLILLLQMSFLSSCATHENAKEDSSHPYSDIQEGFMTQEPRTVREKTNEIGDFFFKNCSQNLKDSYYSKTAYFCNER